MSKPKNVLISIKPEYALKIISGQKTIELRRKFPTEGVAGGLALIYASSPVKEIIGYAVIQDVEKKSIDELWESSHREACVSKAFFYEYFGGREFGYALHLQQPIQLTKPVDLNRLVNEFSLTVPQSFRYAPDDILNCVAA